MLKISLSLAILVAVYDVLVAAAVETSVIGLRATASTSPTAVVW